MVKALLEEMTNKTNSNVDALVERSKTISDLQAMNELLNDPTFRGQVQAILEVMYRMPHTKRRTAKDMIAVAKLLMGFTSDMANEIFARTRAELGILNGNSNLDSGSDTAQPSGKLDFTAPPAVGEGTEATPPPDQPVAAEGDAFVPPSPQREGR